MARASIKNEIIAALKKVKGVVDAQPAGSLRRMRSTVWRISTFSVARKIRRQ
ncbi:MAG: hypothetical protein U0X87_09585 [Anaerolineales bacterium]